jgi:hypothetical protein
MRDIPLWALPHPNDNFVDWEKMKSRFLAKGDLIAVSRIEYKILVMEDLGFGGK